MSQSSEHFTSPPESLRRSIKQSERVQARRNSLALDIIASMYNEIVRKVHGCSDGIADGVSRRRMIPYHAKACSTRHRVFFISNLSLLVVSPLYAIGPIIQPFIIPRLFITLGNLWLMKGAESLVCPPSVQRGR